MKRRLIIIGAVMSVGLAFLIGLIARDCRVGADAYSDPMLQRVNGKMQLVPHTFYTGYFSCGDIGWVTFKDMGIDLWRTPDTTGWIEYSYRYPENTPLQLVIGARYER